MKKAIMYSAIGLGVMMMLSIVLVIGIIAFNGSDKLIEDGNKELEKMGYEIEEEDDK